MDEESKQLLRQLIDLQKEHLELVRKNLLPLWMFCLSRTLSFKDVLEFSTDGKDKLNAESKAFNA